MTFSLTCNWLVFPQRKPRQSRRLFFEESVKPVFLFWHRLGKDYFEHQEQFSDCSLIILSIFMYYTESSYSSTLQQNWFTFAGAFGRGEYCQRCWMKHILMLYSTETDVIEYNAENEEAPLRKVCSPIPCHTCMRVTSDLKFLDCWNWNYAPIPETLNTNA